MNRIAFHAEDDLVTRIARAIPCAPKTRRAISRAATRLRRGIGDDAAILSPNGKSDWVLSCDAFLENVHFLANLHPPDSVRFKSLARATSDIAAMGAAPRFFLLTLAIPSRHTGAWLDQFLKGMARAAHSLGIHLVGGDTTESSHISISVTVLGEVPRGRALLRSGAKPGDIIYVSGTLGRAALAWRWMSSNLGRNSGRKRMLRRWPQKRSLRRLLKPHLYPEIKVDLGLWLATNRMATAAMDLSDGLSTDLSRLCAASGVGARIVETSIPRASILPKLASMKEFAKLRLDPLDLALHGGEDYELLFTVPPSRAKLLRKAPGFSSIVPIGEIMSGKDIIIFDLKGRSSALPRGGWDPFRDK